MTLEEVKAMKICLTEDNVPALCKTTKAGKVMPVRPITGEETAALTAILYTLFKAMKPGEKYMTIPYMNGKVLAVTEVDIAEKTEK